MLGIVLLLYLPALLETTLTLLSNSQVIASAETFDFIQSSYAPFDRTGYFITAAVNWNATSSRCEAAIKQPQPTDRTTYNHTIVLMDWPQARRMCHYRSYSQMWPVALELLATLPGRGFPPSRTIVLPSVKVYNSLMGNPFREPFPAKRPGIPDGPPPQELDVLFISNHDWKNATATLRVAYEGLPDKSAVVAHVVGEYGPWNQAFNSGALTAFNWTLLSGVLFVLGYSCRVFYQLVVAGEAELNLRNVVFLVDVVGTIIFILPLAMRYFTYVSEMCIKIGSATISIAFHLLIYLWTVFLLNIRRSKFVYVIRAAIVLSALIIIVSMVVSIVLLHKRHEAMDSLSRMLLSTRSFGQLLVAFAFAACGMLFFHKTQTSKLSPHVLAALNRLAVVAGIGVLGFLLIAVVNYLKSSNWTSTPGRAVGVYVLMQVAMLVRAVALLAVLSVPKTQKSST